MVNDIVTLTKQLVSIRSTPDNKEALAACIEEAVKPIKDFPIERFEQDGSKSVLIRNTAQRPKKFKVILNGHLDIIPGKEHQYKPIVENDKLYGVGTMDMKASVASFVMVFRAIAKSVAYPVGLQLVTDEEIGGFHGTKYQIDQGVRSDFVIVGETTNFYIENQAKGIVWVKVRSQGKAAHGAYPWSGDNAIWKMHAFLNDLEKHFPLPQKKQWVTTINLAKIETSNKTFNKIPDNCEVWLDIRYIPQETKTIIKTIRLLLPRGFTMETLVQEPAQFVEEDNQYIKHLQKIGKTVRGKSILLNQGQGSSDARHFTRVKNDAIEFGPLGDGMGTDNEWVDILSLADYSEILKRFLESV
jgi:succinyl-diaminopimelate desuccinylase